MVRLRIVLAAGVSVLLLGGAYVFEYLGYAPCTMCYNFSTLRKSA